MGESYKDSPMAEAVGFEPTCPCGQLDFESFPAHTFWWKLSENGSTQRKPKNCGILRILASVFRFYLNPPIFPNSSRFCPELWPEDRTRIEQHDRLGVLTPIPLHKKRKLPFWIVTLILFELIPKVNALYACEAAHLPMTDEQESECCTWIWRSITPTLPQNIPSM